jgi:phosphoribosylformylglycinamidine synthase subunit PurS
VSVFHVDVRIVPRAGILDPQGKAVAGALSSLGFEGISDVHFGRVVTLELEAASEAEARDRVDAMCRQLLANPVTEDFRVELREAAAQETSR